MTNRTKFAQLHHLCAIALTAAVALAAGCEAGDASTKTETAGPELAADGAADHAGFALHVRGTIGLGGEVSGMFAELGWVGWIFIAPAGADMTIELTSADGDPLMYVFGPKSGRSWLGARRIAYNDDYGGTTDSFVRLRIPANGTYMIVARDYEWARTSYTLRLSCTGTHCGGVECAASGSCPSGSECQHVVCIRAPCPSYCAPIDPVTRCDVDAECAAVATSCCPCSMGGHERAVNALYVAGEEPVCDPEEPVRCLAVYLCGSEEPRCVSNRCEMVPTDTAAECGGIAGLACPEGQWCDIVEDYPDATGTCRPLGSCDVADDCGPQGLFHSSCHGYWTCESSSCVYYCGAPPSPGCDYNGAHYAAGDVFPSSDGCNECTCGTDGTVACTERACACDPASEPSRHYIGTPEECTRISYLCAPGTHPFSNACGCGCEDD